MFTSAKEIHVFGDNCLVLAGSPLALTVVDQSLAKIFDQSSEMSAKSNILSSFRLCCVPLSFLNLTVNACSASKSTTRTKDHGNFGLIPVHPPFPSGV